MSNDLIHETSPYLLQHANNPVDWLPWNERALERAREQEKPVLLSIGYAACHWCHVMAHESFEDKDIAEVMNRNFICIKVDREERPDLDRIYQAAHQMLTRRPGGWPLTVALTPDQQAPFFAGTYFPPTPRQGMPGFNELLDKIAQHYRDNKTAMAEHGAAFHRALSQLNPAPAGKAASTAEDWLDNACETLKARFDAVNGGFGDAPRFPHPTQLALLLEHSTAGRAESEVSLAMANKTLRKMHQGGLFDQVGGGFFRYSVDKEWRIPHFEKMLYDNAQLLNLYTDGYRRSGEETHQTAALRTARWVIDEMQQGHGGYASSLDADSEGDEGKFYVWPETDLRAILNSAEYEAIEYRFSLYGEANFEGNWHFNINPEIAPQELLVTPDALASAMAKLRDARNKRVRPQLDDKILTGWNGMMIQAMANAGRILQQPEFIESARAALDFIRANLWKNGRMMATFREGQSRLNGYLDDYVFVAEALLALLQQQWRHGDYVFLQEICNALLEWFEDQQDGGYYFTSHDHENLLYRPKAGADDAIPAANGGAVRLLWQFSQLSGEMKYQQSAQNTIDLFAPEIEKHPSVYANLALAASHTSACSIILRGSNENLATWQEKLNGLYLPGTTVFAIADNASDLPPGLQDKVARRGKTLGYVCHGQTCQEPVETMETLLDQLGQ